MVDLDALYSSLEAVLQDELELELVELLQEDEFGRQTFGSLRDRFDEWVVAAFRRDGSLRALGNTLGRADLRRVIQRLGCEEPPRVLGQMISELERLVGLPDMKLRGRRYLVDAARRLADDVNAEQTRRLVERALREMALVHASSPLQPLLVEVVREDRRTPRAVRQTLDQPGALAAHFANENAGDLGGFAHILRRASQRITEGDLPDGARMLDAELLKEHEFEAMMGVARALSSHVHFKPSQASTREATLRRAVDGFATAMSEMADRRVLPDAVILLERVTGLFGTTWLGIDETGSEIGLKLTGDPALGARVLFREVSNPIRRVVAWSATSWD